MCLPLQQFGMGHAWESPAGHGGVGASVALERRVAVYAGRRRDGGRYTERFRSSDSPWAHLIVTRSEGLIRSIEGRRERKVSTSGIFLSSMVCRTLLRPSGALRMDFRRCMASAL